MRVGIMLKSMPVQDARFLYGSNESSGGKPTQDQAAKRPRSKPGRGPHRPRHMRLVIEARVERDVFALLACQERPNRTPHAHPRPPRRRREPERLPKAPRQVHGVTARATRNRGNRIGVVLERG